MLDMSQHVARLQGASLTAPIVALCPFSVSNVCHMFGVKEDRFELFTPERIVCEFV